MLGNGNGIRDMIVVENDGGASDGNSENNQGPNQGGGNGGGSGGSQVSVSIADRTITVPSIVSFYTDEELNSAYHAKSEYENAINNYGCIYKTINFSETSDKEKIKTYCREWIRRNYFDGVISFTVKAIDLHLLGYNVDKLSVGDRIPITYFDRYKTPVTKILTCLSAKYDLFKPENSTFKIGIPGVSDNPKWRQTVSVTSSMTATNNANTVKQTAESLINLENRVQTIVNSLFENAGIDIDSVENANGTVYEPD